MTNRSYMPPAAPSPLERRTSSEAVTESALACLLRQSVGTTILNDLAGVAGVVSEAIGPAARDRASADSRAAGADAAEAIRRRLALWRAVCGDCGPKTAAELCDLVGAQGGGSRLSFHLDGLHDHAQVPQDLVPVFLLSMLVAGHALPKGGAVRLRRLCERTFHILPEGPRSQHRPEVLQALAFGHGDCETQGAPALALTLRAVAALAAVEIDLHADVTTGAAALYLSLPPGPRVGAAWDAASATAADDEDEIPGAPPRALAGAAAGGACQAIDAAC